MMQARPQSVVGLVLCILALLSTAVPATQSSPGCTTELDCELNGACRGGTCLCFPGWTGPTCGTLKLLPAPTMSHGRSPYALYPPRRPLPPHHEGPGSAPSGPAADVGHRRTGSADPLPGVPITWGGTVAADDAGTLHLFVDVCCYNPASIMHDTGGCQTVHAVGTALNQTFAFRSVALPPQHTCPHIIRADDGTYLLYTTGTAMACNTTCTGAEAKLLPRVQVSSSPSSFASALGSAPTPTPAPCVGTGFFGLNVATSRSLDGPWTTRDNLPINNYGDPLSNQTNVNPAPLLLPNGTVVIAYCDHDAGEQIALAKADNPAHGPYTKLGAPGQPIFAHHCEDPFLYKGRLGYHIICHDMEKGTGGQRNGCRLNGSPGCSGQVGLHAFAPTLEGDGSGWTTAPRLAGSASAPSAYSTNVTFTDGSTWTFFRRERPELRTNAAGDPTHLITGIEYFADHPGLPGNHQYSFTLVQEVDLSGGFRPERD